MINSRARFARRLFISHNGTVRCALHEVPSSTMTTTSNSTTTTVSSLHPMPDETTFEFWTDLILGVLFLTIFLLSAQRMLHSRQLGSGGAAETTVVTAFYSLICVTSFLRAVWFLIPNSVWQPTYVPDAAMAFFSRDWMGRFVSNLVVSAGSLSLFSIFILILVYWADILKKYFYPGARRSRPMVTFLTLVGLLVAVVVANAACFLLGLYSTEGMILVNAILLAMVSMVCVAQITVFSHRFRTVLKTLGAINQVSTESQVKRIVWITVTGNLFFLARAALETAFSILLLMSWHTTGSVNRQFTHAQWDAYIWVKHGTEVAILALMLYILQSRFASQQQREGYQPVPDAAAADKQPEQQENVVV